MNEPGFQEAGSSTLRQVGIAFVPENQPARLHRRRQPGRVAVLLLTGMAGYLLWSAKTQKR
jgi:hypothetical protein